MGHRAVLHADEATYGAQAETFLTYLKLLQDDSFGDPDVTPAFAEVETRSDFLKAGNAWKADVRAAQAEESARLFYVAVTRAERKLLVTAARANATSSREIAPYVHFAAMRDLVPGSVAYWSGADDQSAGGAEVSTGRASAPAIRTGTWPHMVPDASELAAAATVSAAREELPALSDGELYSLWERDTSALIQEHEAAFSPDVPVVVPGELTASDVVAMRADPAQFARRARRPVPFKPNAYAKRGTAFHEWLEGFYGARPLLDEDELPGSGEAEVDRAILHELKANFEASHWAARTPAFVERPFELALGDSVVRGRIDAIFEDADGWTVVDWKTGQRPNRAEMESAKLQLAVYREAWRRIAGDGRDVRAVFFYVRTGEDFAPTDVPDGAELERLLALESAPGSSAGWGTVSPVRADSETGSGRYGGRE
ncbi:PD-(D/E)XK nuclease family protein [Corynebacterium sp. CNCTC7651]|uniref:RecB family exonuclease n=1 Tax=Corynebacterium sp. CNCTC7651 TaxID=2815361 RepID=UPI00351D7FE2